MLLHFNGNPFAVSLADDVTARLPASIRGLQEGEIGLLIGATMRAMLVIRARDIMSCSSTFQFKKPCDFAKTAIVEKDGV